MTRSKAYEVLGLETSASTEEIKTTYAELSKKYHPEECPKEFQEIHEAYVTLTRHGTNISLKRILFLHETKKIFDEYMEQDTEDELEYDFEAAIQYGEDILKREYDIKTEKLCEELDELFVYPGCYGLKNFKSFFERKEYEEVYNCSKFIRKLTCKIRDIKLKPEIYSYIIEKYNLCTSLPDELTKEQKNLSIAISIYYSVEWDIVGKKVLIMQLGGIVLCIIAVLNCINIFNFMRNVFLGAITICDIPKFFLVIPIIIIIYRFIYRFTSNFFANVFTAGIVAIFAGIGSNFEFFVTMFFTKNECEMFCVELMLLSIVWIVIAGSVELMDKVNFKKKSQF